MSIATVDDLSALGDGVEVVVDSSTNGRASYIKATDGRLRHTITGAMVRPEMFVGSIAAGAVRLAGEVPPEVGELFLTGSYHYLVVGIDGDQVHVGRFRRETWYGLAHYPLATFVDPAVRRVVPADHPAWVPQMLAVVSAMHSLNVNYQQLTTTYNTLLAQPIPAHVVQDLHAYAASVDDDEFENLLARHSIGRQRIHHSEVRASGIVWWTPSNAMVRDAVGLGSEFELTNDTVSVRWERVIHIDRQGVGCTCGEVDEDVFRAWLPPDYQDLDYEVNCI